MHRESFYCYFDGSMLFVSVWQWSTVIWS